MAVRVTTVAQLLVVLVARLAMASNFFVGRVALQLDPARDWQSGIRRRP